MTHRWRLIFAGLIGACIPVLALVMLWFSRPDFVGDEDAVSALTVAVSSQLEMTSPEARRVLYVSSFYEDRLVEVLARDYPTFAILPSRNRPKDTGCKASSPEAIVMGPCGRDDYISVELKAFPLWRTALVGIGTFNSGSELLLVKFFGEWRVISSTTYVI
jgi:hypothetical protein